MRAAAWIAGIALLAGAGTFFAGRRPAETPAGLAERPLAEWRLSAAPFGLLPLPDGTAWEVPADPSGQLDISMSYPRPLVADDRSMLSLGLDETTGRLAWIADVGPRLQVRMWLERMEDPGMRAITRAMPAQRPGAPATEHPVWAAETPPVAFHHEGSSHGRRYAVGCWRTTSVNPDGGPHLARGLHDCVLAMPNATLGGVTVDFRAPELDAADPMPPSVARLERIVGLLAAIEASFSPRGGAP